MKPTQEVRPLLRPNRNRIGRRRMRALSKLVPDFHDLDLGLHADDLLADLRPGVPVVTDRAR